MSTARISTEERRIAELLSSDAMQPAYVRIAVFFGGMTNCHYESDGLVRAGIELLPAL